MAVAASATDFGFGSGASVLETLQGQALAWISRIAFRSVIAASGAVVGGVGLAFIPASMGLRVQGRVKGVPGLSYTWNRDETHFLLTLKGADGRTQTVGAWLGDGDIFRDRQGRAVARVLPNGIVAVDPAAAFGAIAAARTKPSLCPVEEPDKFGQGMKSVARAYEDYAKQFVNPGDPTPSALAYYLNNPTDPARRVSYDDCQHDSGIMFEFKGPWFGKLPKFKSFMQDSIGKKLVNQAVRQVEASRGRPVVWAFANQAGADYTRDLFNRQPELEGRVTVTVIPWDRDMMRRN